MRYPFLVLLTLAGVVLGDASAFAQRGRGFEEQSTAQRGWVASLGAGLRQARQTGKPLMVVLRCVP